MIEFDAMPTLVKEEMVRYGLYIMALKAMAQAETKDFYCAVADYDNFKGTGIYKETVEIKGFDNDGGGVWIRNIRIAFDSAATEHAQYKVVIDANNIYVYSADGTLKGKTGVGFGFWGGVKSDGSDIRVANQDLTTPTQRYFWIDEFDYTSKKAVIWVRVEDGDAELNIAYGNPSATMSSYNNPNQVFEFYDDFNSFKGWTTWGTINTEILDGVLHIHGVNDGDAGFYRTDYQFSNFILETREKISSREPASPAIRLTDNNNMYYFAWYWIDNSEYIRITKRVSGTDTNLAGSHAISAEYNVWRNIRIIANGTNLKMEVYTDGWKSLVGSISASDTEFSSGGIGFRAAGNSSNPSEGYMDWVRVLKFADPISISSIQHTPSLETINLDNNGRGVWSRNIRITFDSAATEHAQYKVVIDANNIYVYSADGTLKGQTGVDVFWDGVKSDGSDIRVANQDLTTPTQRYFWIDEFDYANKQAVIWVRVEDGDTELNIAYGNPTALPSTYNNISQTFIIGDDFEDGDLDWTITAGSATESGGVLTIPSAGGIIHKSSSYLTGIWEVKFKWTVGQTSSEQAAAARVYPIYIDTDNFYDIWFNTGSGDLWIRKMVGGTMTWIARKEYTVDTNWHTIKIVRYSDGTFKVYLDGNLMLTVTDTSLTSSSYTGLHNEFHNVQDIQFDNFRYYKLADPISISSIQHIPSLETINFDFPDGIDKVLITVDGDNSQIEYSTDGGTTWNVIQSDTETLLPTTAYQIKFKFTGGLKGYAFLAW